MDDAKANLDILVEGLKPDHKLSLALNGERELHIGSPQTFCKLGFTQIFSECLYAGFAIDLVNNIPLTSSNLVRNP